VLFALCVYNIDDSNIEQQDLSTVKNFMYGANRNDNDITSGDPENGLTRRRTASLQRRQHTPSPSPFAFTSRLRRVYARSDRDSRG
jgi:hypothetical protein